MFAIRPFGITTLGNFKECIVLWPLHKTVIFMVLQFHILCGIVNFFALFSEVSGKAETEQMETLSICCGGAGFAA